VGRVIEILVLQAKALQAQGTIGQALTGLERAFSLAEPEGYVRTFIDEGAPMGELLQQAAARGISVEYVRGCCASKGVESAIGRTSKSKSKVPRYPSGGLCVLPLQSPT